MKKFIIFIFIAVSAFKIYSQELNISQYVFYRDGMNPGSFIQDNDINVFVLYNNEFSGFRHEPRTQIADVSFNVKGHKLGVSVINDNIGFDIAQNVKIRYARQFALSEKSFFSFGLSAGGMHNRFESTKMTFENEGDPLSFTDYTYTRLDFDFGAEIQFENLFMGLSVTHLGKQAVNPENDSPISHYYAYAQYAINSKNSFRFFPNVLMRYWKNTYWAEASVIAFYKNLAWLGIVYTRNHDLSFTTGVRVTKKVMFGYGFKSNMNSQILRSWGTNSHEIFLNFAINKEVGGIKTPRLVD